MNIIVTGNIATGSSAVIDLLSEYSSCTQALRNDYEHAVFIYPNGLFNLRDSLFSSNANCTSQDHDIILFLEAMSNLYKYDYGFFGGYKKLIGPEFKNNYLSFINAVATPIKTTSYARYKRSHFSLIKASAQALLKTNPNVFGIYSKIDYSPFYEMLSSHETFDNAARKFVESYFVSCRGKTENMVFDHLLWHDNIESSLCLFPEKTKIIYVERDPRDIYLFYKYYYARKTTDGYPLNMPDFCTFFLSQRKNPLPMNENILQVQFEDLLFNYENEVRKIECFCGLAPKEHIAKFSKFNPSKSIANVGLYLRNNDSSNELSIIQKILPEYLYSLSPATVEQISKGSKIVF